MYNSEILFTYPSVTLSLQHFIAFVDFFLIPTATILMSLFGHRSLWHLLLYSEFVDRMLFHTFLLPYFNHVLSIVIFFHFYLSLTHSCYHIFTFRFSILRFQIFLRFQLLFTTSYCVYPFRVSFHSVGTFIPPLNIAELVFFFFFFTNVVFCCYRMCTKSVPSFWLQKYNLLHYWMALYSHRT